MTIDLNANPIEAEELINNIKIRSNGLVLGKLTLFLAKAQPILNVSVNDILELFGAKEGKYSNDVVEKAALYSTLTDDEKNKISNDEKELFESVLRYKKDNIQRLIQTPFKLIEVLIKDGIVNNEPVGLFNDFLELLEVATGQDKSRLFLSDFDIWAEIFTRIIFKKQGEANKSFFIMNAIEKLISNIPLLSFMKKESLNM